MKDDWPSIPPELVEYLEAAYPPRCMYPGESIEEHLRYAGKVDLVIAISVNCRRAASPAEEDLDSVAERLAQDYG